MQAYLLITNKRVNSTKAVSVGAGNVPQTVELKDTTDITQPVIEFSSVGLNNPTVYNYLYLPTFYRYYFIDYWEYSRTIWYAHCTEDYLGSWRNSILGQQRYVTRTAKYSLADFSVSDAMYPATCGIKKIVTLSRNLNWAHNFAGTDGGWYVVGIIGKGGVDTTDVTNRSYNAGVVDYWVLSANQLALLIDYLMAGLGTSDWLDFNSWVTQVERVMIDPFQYIVSCLFYPYEPPHDVTARYITFGAFATTCTGYMLNQAYGTSTATIDISAYTDASNPSAAWPDSRQYTYCDPYRVYTLELNPFGVMELDSRLLYGARYLGLWLKNDYVTGSSLLNVYAQTTEPVTRLNPLLKTRTATIGVQMQLTQNTATMLGKAVDVGTNAIENIVGGGTRAGVVGALTGGVQTIMSNLMSSWNGKFESKGSNGGIASLEGYALFNIYQQEFVEEAPDEVGYCCGKNVILTNDMGFTICAEGDIEISGALKSEVEAISEFLTSGCYLE